jgi:hypothetical protein
MIKDVIDLLDRHTLTSLGVDGSSHNTITPLADNLTDLVPV